MKKRKVKSTNFFERLRRMEAFKLTSSQAEKEPVFYMAQTNLGMSASLLLEEMMARSDQSTMQPVEEIIP